jgi:hypothetical protein
MDGQPWFPLPGHQWQTGMTAVGPIHWDHRDHCCAGPSECGGSRQGGTPAGRGRGGELLGTTPVQRLRSCAVGCRGRQPVTFLPRRGDVPGTFNLIQHMRELLVGIRDLAHGVGPGAVLAKTSGRKGREWDEERRRSGLASGPGTRTAPRRGGGHRQSLRLSRGPV